MRANKTYSCYRQQGDYVFGNVGLPFCLFVSNMTQKVVVMKSYGGVQGGKRNKWLNIGGDGDHHADCPIGNLAITQQIMSVFWLNFQGSSAMIQGTID